jgi:hypothetical protein
MCDYLSACYNFSRATIILRALLPFFVVGKKERKKKRVERCSYAIESVKLFGG